jgi:NAD(P)-dependent dehydrogenase (short-subunit alcohol dehydrogenase family)
MNNGGGVVFITVAADRYNVPAYDSCKGAIKVFSRYVATEYGFRGIRENSVAPGGIVPRLQQRRDSHPSRRHSSGSSGKLPWDGWVKRSTEVWWRCYAATRPDDSLASDSRRPEASMCKGIICLVPSRLYDANLPCSSLTA